jgi:hypothetical protein
MRIHAARIAACATLLCSALIGTGGAQTPSPAPSPVPTPVAFSAHAHANATFVMQSGTYSGTVQLGMAQRANLTRIDVISIKSDTFPVPPISVTVVVDRTARKMTAWSDATKLYHVQSLLPGALPSIAPRPTGSPSASPSPRPQGGTSPFSKLEVFEVTMKLIGHTATLGVPTTGMSFDMQVRNRGDKATSHVTATTQLADEFAAFPMSFDVSVEPGAAPLSAKISYAVDELTRDVPPAARFTVPAGYTEAPSLIGIIFPGRPTASPKPSPKPTPR